MTLIHDAHGASDTEHVILAGKEAVAGLFVDVIPDETIQALLRTFPPTLLALLHIALGILFAHDAVWTVARRFTSINILCA